MAAAGKIQHLWRSGGEFFALSKCYPTYQLPVINGIIYNPYKWGIWVISPLSMELYITKKEFGGKWWYFQKASPKIDALSELTFVCLKKSSGNDCLGRGAASPLVDTCGKIWNGGMNLSISSIWYYEALQTESGSFHIMEDCIGWSRKLLIIREWSLQLGWTSTSCRQPVEGNLRGAESCMQSNGKRFKSKSCEKNHVLFQRACGSRL